MLRETHLEKTRKSNAICGIPIPQATSRVHETKAFPGILPPKPNRSRLQAVAAHFDTQQDKLSLTYKCKPQNYFSSDSSAKSDLKLESMLLACRTGSISLSWSPWRTTIVSPGKKSGLECGNPKCGSIDINSFCQSPNKITGGPGDGCYNVDGPTATSPTNGTEAFANACPDAFSYSTDIANHVYFCQTGSEYSVVFCPIPFRLNTLEWLSVVESFLKIFHQQFRENLRSMVSSKCFINSFPKMFHQQFRQNVPSLVSSKCLINSFLKMFDQ
jgi:hypothetical protein